MFLYRFFQMLRCSRGQTDHQRWMVKYEIARQKAVDAWLDATTPKPPPDHADVTAMSLLRLKFFEKLLEHVSERKFDAHGMEHQVDWQQR